MTEGAAARPVPGGVVAAGALVAAWVTFLAIYLSHRVVLSPDSMNNYAHVWWLANQLWRHGVFPWRMPVLGHGQAFTFPYGFLNWTTAALVRPVFGDWTVTLWSAAGAVGCLVATFFVFPELRRGWWAAAALANPAIFEALLLGQQSFAWAGALVLAGIGCWRRHRPLAAAVLVGLGQATHPAVLLPSVLVVVGLACLAGKLDRRAVLRWYGLSVAIAAPAAVLVLISPVYTDSTLSDKVLNFLSTVGPRLLLLLVPVAFVLMARTGRRALAPAALVLALALNVALARPLGVEPAWDQMHRHPAVNLASLDQFVGSASFRPGVTYRVLRPAWDAKFGLYRLLRSGARLDSEFFPESMATRSFRDSRAYERLLCQRKVDVVLVFAGYDRSYHTNEHQLLRSLAGGAGGGGVSLQAVGAGSDYTAYAVNRRGCPA